MMLKVWNWRFSWAKHHWMLFFGRNDSSLLLLYSLRWQSIDHIYQLCEHAFLDLSLPPTNWIFECFLDDHRRKSIEFSHPLLKSWSHLIFTLKNLAVIKMLVNLIEIFLHLVVINNCIWAHISEFSKLCLIIPNVGKSLIIFALN